MQPWPTAFYKALTAQRLYAFFIGKLAFLNGVQGQHIRPGQIGMC
jgi:hypothetical protein